MMKKLIAMALAVILVLSCTVAAFAVQNVTNGEVNESGSITIAGANKNYDYALFKLLHLDTYDNANGAYTYKVEEKWAGFFATDVAQAYISIDGSGHVSWVDGADIVQFAKDVLAYADANGITPEADTDSDNFTSNPNGGTFTGLSLGYYLVDTSMGALCGLSTAKPDGYISVKNGNNQDTPVDATTTYTYGFEIYNIDSKDQPLQGAEFKLLDSNKEEITLAYNTVTGEYRRATSLGDHEDWCENTVVVSNANGIAKVVGLGKGTYYLRQTKAPDGFKTLTTDREFIISGNNLYADRDDNGAIFVGSSVYVVNNKGVTLPEIGGDHSNEIPSDNQEETPSENREEIPVPEKSGRKSNEAEGNIMVVVLIAVAGGLALGLVVGLVIKKQKS